MRLSVLATSLLLVPLAAGASAKTESLTLRGQSQALHVYGARGGPVALVASGDGGWTHLAPRVAEFLAGQGYFVVGLDSKAYLSSFTQGATTLLPADVPRDFTVLLDYAAGGAGHPPLLVGVSEGAGLCVLAAGDDTVKARAGGVLALGLPDQNELGWRFRDSVIYVTKGRPKEPLFSAADVIGKVAPLPVAAIHSTRDEFVPVDQIQRVMDRARDPKRLWLIEAENHRFEGKEAELTARLLEAIAWITAQRR
jgi:alpha-beta hydrolase superfamily lysophospholipase